MTEIFYESKTNLFPVFLILSEIYAFIHTILSGGFLEASGKKEEQNMKKDLQEKGYFYDTERFADMINGVVCPADRYCRR